MLEAIVIIIALGGLEIALWMADHKRQAEQLATLEAIWVELALLNEEKAPQRSEAPLGQPELIVMPEASRAAAH
jgi:hypothetical protein